MKERTGVTTLKGNPVTLLGPTLQVGGAPIVTRQLPMDGIRGGY